MAVVVELELELELALGLGTMGLELALAPNRSQIRQRFPPATKSGFD